MIKITRIAGIACSMLLLAFAGQVHSTPVTANALSRGDDRILAAREAFRTGDRKTLEQLAAVQDGHVLDVYVRYWLLTNQLARLTEVPQQMELAAFITNHQDSATARLLQASWLRRMFRDQDWQGFLTLYASYVDPDSGLKCQAWVARMNSGDTALFSEVAHEWSLLLNAPESCYPVFQTAINRGSVTTDAVWQRIRYQMDSRRPEQALITLGWLNNIAPKETQFFRTMIKSKVPEAVLPKIVVAAGDRVAREQLIATLIRVVRADPQQGYAQFKRYEKQLKPADCAYLYLVLGHHAALSRLPEALQWYRLAGDNTPASAVQRQWRVRAALRAEDWVAVEHYIRLLPIQEQQEPEWVYWYGRALLAQDRPEQAEALLMRIADETDFYGQLASEELGRTFHPPRQPAPISSEALKQARNTPAVQRALALYRLDMRYESFREWAHMLRGKDAAFMVATAQLAFDNGMYDRAINTAELADKKAHYELRFITPYLDIIEPQVKQQNLDLAWVYGLMRQESRFVVPARSSAGARGLMQVMPATGQWVAKKIGLSNYRVDMLNDPDTNVLLGTSYMRIIMNDLDNHQVLASAGYNAGPGRARRWRDQRPLEGAIYVETIPIDETRDYVKKVLANAVVYAAMFEKKPQSLKSRMGVILPRASG